MDKYTGGGQKGGKYFSLSLLLFFFQGWFATAQQQADYCKTTKLVISSLEINHYDPPEFSATVRKEVVSMFMESLDPNGIYFIASDKEVLDSSCAGTENYFCCLLEKATPIYRQRLSQTDSLVTAFLARPVNFNERDTFYYEPHHAGSFQENQKALQRNLFRKIKFDILCEMHDLKEDSVSSNDLSKITERAKNKCLKSYRKHTRHLIKDPSGLQSRVAESLWNAITLRCDPHSCYFNTMDKEDFDRDLSTEELSFGLVVSENEDGEIEIVNLVPGSPAWKTNEFNIGDIISGITLEDGTQLELSSMSEEEIEKIIESSSDKRLRFSIKKKNNNEKKVDLERALIHSEENNINGYLLRDSSHAIGYLSLPAFYINSEDEDALGCANDVAREILKLGKEPIHGLILDLRNNGGGSLKEAMDLAGIFIDEGPLGIVKVRNEKPATLRDMNRGTVYDGPLVVLVNGLSASASEFLAAVLQDYHRAVIAGDRTYGKGTGQVVIQVDSLETNSSKNKSGFLKVTTFKFYRVTNTTTQSIGVIPDIEIPDMYQRLDFFKEAKAPFRLQADSIVKKVVFKPSPPLPMETIRQKSRERIKNNKQFYKVERYSDSIVAWNTGKIMLLLNEKTINEYLERGELFEQQLETLTTYETPRFSVENNKYQDSVLKLDGYSKDANQTEIRNIRSDAAIEEAFCIIKDLIQYSNSKTK